MGQCAVDDAALAGGGVVRWRGAATLLVRAGELRAASELVAGRLGRIDRQAAYRIERLLWEAAQRRPG